MLTFELKARARGRAQVKGELVTLEAVPKEITNLIFSLALRRTDLTLVPTYPSSFLSTFLGSTVPPLIR